LDFSGVPDPVMFQRLLDAADYWFGYSDNSSAGSYDPARECFVVLTNTWNIQQLHRFYPSKRISKLSL
jgi:hypothetical protein